MKLIIISHKEVWKEQESYFTSGGFPFQIKAMSEIFSETRLICSIRRQKKEIGLTEISGNRLLVSPLPEPWFSGWMRHLAIGLWIPIHLKTVWKEIKSSDIVHTMVPGDIGLIGTLLSLILRKPLFVRHCGTWGNHTTITDRFIHWLLPKIAKGKNVVMATGGGKDYPEPLNRNIKWIFSTSITKHEWANLQLDKPWDGEESLNLITVGRLSNDKNVQSIIRALPKLQKHFQIKLDIVGDGDKLNSLLDVTKSLGLENNVTFHGNCRHDEVLKLLSNNHIFVFPTNTKEGFPKALLEAMACGLPSIATRVSVIPFLIENKCGIVIDHTNPNAIADAVLVMTSIKDEMREMGQRARKISKEYTLENWRDIIGARLEQIWGPLN